jgi:hypothetical protein
MVLYLGVLIVFSLRRESLKLILVIEPLPEVVLSHSWTGTVGPSLPSFTIAPCVDSLLCYRIDKVA